MTIKVGDRVPDGKLSETTEFDSATQCAMAPKEVNVADALKGKKIAVFGLPGAYTPTCSAKHVPSYVSNRDQLMAKGVNEIWRRHQRRLLDGALGRDQRRRQDPAVPPDQGARPELDSSTRGMGTRMARFMLVDNGVVKQLNVEAPGKFEVSGGDTMLKQL
jgi:peroxiredoxin